MPQAMTYPLADGRPVGENEGMHPPNPASSILDLPQVSGRYFFPQDRSVNNPFVVEVPGALLHCFHRVVAPENLTLVHFHGNGEAVADYVPEMADELASLGLNSLFVEYRQYGGSTGQAHLVAMLGDGEAAIAVAGLVPEQTLVLGRSMGSFYAIELVHRHPRIAGLIIESGIADVAQRLLKYADLSAAGISADEVQAEVKRHFNHKQKLSGYQGQVLILHTEQDGLIDISHAERNHRWAGGTQKQLLRFPLGNHNTILARNRVEYFQAIGRLARIAGNDRQIQG